MKALTFKTYRIIDLTLIGVLFFIMEIAVTKAGRVWFPNEPYSLSLAIIFFCLGLMRWGAWSCLYPVIGGLATCIASGATGKQFAIYCIGNLLVMLALVMFRVCKKKRIRESGFLTVLFVILVFVLAQLGRFTVSLFFGAEPAMLVKFLTTDSLSGVFAIIVILISRKPDGLFEDQKAYLIRLDEERRKEREKEG